ncbi:MAG: pyridoxal 5'-phosphate synthase glutaminase subunit PdxT [Candidatus Peribacteraceae bacterium]|nr:pyridoxal 5'-phosphate synthase glutaminase subunit PdxT [Candidatus Peribacteraceae bacterium]
MNREPTIGVLAFQGDFAEHLDVLRSLNVSAIEVRALDDLAKVDGLIIPGGESTVIARFLKETGVGEEIVRRAGRAEKAGRAKGQKGKSAKGIINNDESGSTDPRLFDANHRPLFIYGTCAGAIVLAKEATGKNAPKPLGLIDVTIDRNAYGTQVDSFETEILIDRTEGKRAKRQKGKTSAERIAVAFIRAPKITRVGKGVEILAKHKGLPVLVRQGNVLAGTFHPEVRGERRVHEMFLRLIAGR